MSILQRLSSLFSGKTNKLAVDSDNPPAHYWPEVQRFIEDLKTLVDEKTRDEPQVHDLNRQVLEFLEKQIEKKGEHGTQVDKAIAMEIIADRVLTTTLNKITGLKTQTNRNTDFSDLVKKFKDDLQARKNLE